MCRGCAVFGANGKPLPEREYTAEEWSALEAKYRVSMADMLEHQRRLEAIIINRGRGDPAPSF